MTEFDFKRPTRRCCQTEREIAPGEPFYSALVETANGDLQRQDYLEEVWQGPPDHCVGWWRTRIPTLEKGKIYWAPPAVLLAYFEHVVAQTDQQEMAYITALLLVRKRILQWKETVENDQRKWLIVNDPKRKLDFEVEEKILTDEQIRNVQAILAEKLFTDQRDMELDDGHSPAVE